MVLAPDEQLAELQPERRPVEEPHEVRAVVGFRGLAYLADTSCGFSEFGTGDAAVVPQYHLRPDRDEEVRRQVVVAVGRHAAPEEG